MRIRPIKTRIFREGDDLVNFVLKAAPQLRDGSVLVVTSKIVALAEGRTAPIKERERLIQTESAYAKKTKHVWLTVKDGLVMPNAGIDDSNADGGLVLLPKDSFKAAETLRKVLKKHYSLKRLGILITDSRVMPLRAGVVGVALGYAGFKGVNDYRGKKDIFGRKMKITQVNVADSLATAATLEMGEGSERRPLAIIEDASLVWNERTNKKELIIGIQDDMYGPLFKDI